MPSPFIFIFLAAALSTPAAAKQPGCEEFARNTSFTSSEALGIWHLLHLRAHPTDSTDAHCVNFSRVDEKERNDLSTRIGKFVTVKWENLALKMQIPCAGPTGQNNKTRDYYLEKMDVEGSYKTLQIPSPNTKLDTADFHRHPMRLKLVEKKYLAMMDCQEHFMFLLDKQPHTTDLEPALKIILQAYMPDEQ